MYVELKTTLNLAAVAETLKVFQCIKAGVDVNVETTYLLDLLEQMSAVRWTFTVKLCCYFH